MKTHSVLKTTLALIFGLATGLAAHAATDTWTGGGTDSYWGTAGNWGGTAPGAIGDNLVFSGSTHPISTNNLVTSVGWIQLNPSAAFTLYGTVITNSVAFTNSAASSTWIIPLVLGGIVNFDVATGTTLNISNVVSGVTGAGILDTSAGTLALNNLANTFPGPVSVATGATLQLGNLSSTATYAFPGSGLSVNNATLFFNGSSGGTVVHTYNFANLTSPIAVTNSNVKFTSSNATTKSVNAQFLFAGTNTFTYTSSAYTHSLNFNRGITGNGMLVFNWSGTASGRSININDTLNSNSFAGTIVLNTTPTAGNFNLNKPMGGPVAYVVSNIWTLVNAPSNNLDTATAISIYGTPTNGLNLSSFGMSNSSAPLLINGGRVTLGNTSTGTVVYVGNLSGTATGYITNSGTAPSSFSVYEAGNTTFAGGMNDSSAAPLTFTKNGPGTLTLSGSNGLAGATTILNGTLQLTGLLGSTNVTVSTNATLSGTGTLLGTVQVNAGGTVSALSTLPLTMSALSLGVSPADGVTINVTGNGTLVAGYLAVTNSGTFTNNGTVTFNVTGSLPTTIGATYTLLSYAGTSAGTGTYVVGALTSGLIGYVTNNVSASAIQLVVTGGDYLRWAGTPTNNWDLSGSNVWAFGSSGAPAAFANSQSTVFDDRASNFTVNVAATVAPGGINLSNSANNYVFAGSGKITGGTTLTMNGTGNLTLTTTNDYTGLTTVSGGTLQLGDGTANNGSVAGAIADNAAVTFADPGAQTYSGAISGSGTVSKTGAGTLTLAGSNSYNGATTVSAGTLRAGSGSALGTTNGATTVVSGAALDVNGQNLGAEPVSVSGTGAGGNGVVVNNGAAQTQALQSLALNANSTIGGLARWDVRGTGSTLTLNGYTLTKTATNQVTVVGSTVSDGNITVNQGEFGFQVGTIFPQGTGEILVNPAGTLGVSDWGTPLQVNQPVVLNGGTLLADAGGTTATLGSSVTMTTNSVITVNCPLTLTNYIGGTGNLTVNGSSILVLDASNIWSGSLLIASNATVQIGNNDLNGYLPANIGVVTNNGLLSYSVSSDLVFTQAMVGSGGLEQAGYSTLSITNFQNYTGKTVLDEGTIALAAGNNTLSNATTVSFIGSSTLNLGTNSQQVSGLTINGNITGTIQGAATLTVIGANDLRLGSTGNTTPTLDLYNGGLYSFVYNEPGNVFSVGGQATAANSAGTVNLALTNAITASRFGIADAGGYPGYSSSGTVNLGAVNVINANTIDVGCGTIGSSGWASTGTLDFSGGVSNPTLVVRDATGAGRANITVGFLGVSDYSAGNGTVDLYDNVTGASTIDILAGNFILGQHTYKNVNYSRAATGTFIMGNGIVNATNLILGQKNYTGGLTGSSASGTFTQNGGLVTVNAILVGDQQFTNGPSVSGTYNLNAGTLEAQTILAGAGSATRSINWNGGILQNYTNSNLTVTGVGLAVGSGATVSTLNIAAGKTGYLAGSLSGGSPLVSLGGGTVILGADDSSYNGTLTNMAGTLYANGPMPSGTVETYSGTLFGGSNSVGTVNIDAGGTIQPGDINTNGVLTAGTLNLGGAGDTADVTYSRFSLAAGTQIASTTLNVNGTNWVSITGPILTAGTNNLILYSGTIGGNGIGGFKLASLPAGVSAYLQDNAGTAVQLVVTSALNTTPTNITSSVSGSTLTLGWPADHTGWRLEVQTNNLATGVSANPADWGTVSGSTSTNQEVITIDPTKTGEYYRLVYP